MSFVSKIPASVNHGDEANAILNERRIDFLMENVMANDDTPDLVVDAIAQQYGFSKERVEQYREDILAMLMELPEKFRQSSKGQGSSFVSANVDKDGKVWTMNPVYIEALFAAGMAIGRVKFLLPRHMWDSLQAGMPYYQITNDVITLDEALNPDFVKNAMQAMENMDESDKELVGVMLDALQAQQPVKASATLAPERPAVRSLSDIAAEIRRDWKKPYFGAVPYLDALSQLDSINDSYGADDAKSMVIYFLANAQTWRGDVAKRVKAELKQMAGIK